MWDPSEPHQSHCCCLISLCPLHPPLHSTTSLLLLRVGVSALMKTLGGEAISHLIPSNTLDMFQHSGMGHRLVLFGVWLGLCCGKRSAKWVMYINCLQAREKLEVVFFRYEMKGDCATHSSASCSSNLCVCFYELKWRIPVDARVLCYVPRGSGEIWRPLICKSIVCWSLPKGRRGILWCCNKYVYLWALA